MTISMPRNWVEVAHALVIRPFSACASIRRWPSIRVIGSTTTLVLAMGLLLPGAAGPFVPAGGSPVPPSTGSSRARRRWRIWWTPVATACARHAGRRADRQRGAEEVDPAARRRTRRRRAAGRRTASSCPRSSARCSRCRDARRRSASWCGCSTGRSGRARRSPAPCSPPDTGTTPSGPPRRRTLRRTGRRRSWRAAGTDRECARRRRRAGGPRHRARAAGRR